MMMTSNLLSRLLPSNVPSRSIYEDIRAHDEASESDIEERAGMALDEENLGFQDDELGNEDLFNGEDSRITTASTAFLPATTGTNKTSRNTRPKWMAQSPRLLEEDVDDDVPASLLVEGNEFLPPATNSPRNKHSTANTRRAPIPGPTNRESRAHWEATQAQQRLHQDGDNLAGRRAPHTTAGLLTGSAKDKAMYRWMNVQNIDFFINDVYDYYIGSGIWCITLSAILDLLTNIFVAVFVTFLTQCVDFKAIPHSKMLDDVLVPQCTKKISGMTNLAIWCFTLYVIFRTYGIIREFSGLFHMHDFFLHLLEIPDSDMQSISWQDIVARIMALRDFNAITIQKKMSPAGRRFMGTQSKMKLDAHDIANRIMRKDNYLIALFNKEVLNLTVPWGGDRQFFSRLLLWNIEWCLMDLVFNPENGQIRQLVLKESHRRELSNALRNRFLIAGFLNLLMVPVIASFLTIVYVLTYFKEFQANPSAIGARKYTPLAEWKFREFNELQHIFRKRIDMSHPFAKRYLDQFPKVKTARIAKFVAFISGAIGIVLVLATLWDQEFFLSFEITQGRTVLFYISIFGAIWAISNGSIPDENLVFDPEYALRNVIDYTHHMPNHWENRLHSDDVKKEFSALYQMKIIIFLEEVLSIAMTPIILWGSLPQSCDQIIDFFREFTLHVDGVGYVCSFAVFDFKKGIGNVQRPQQGGNVDVREDYYSTKHGKMAASYYGFLDNYSLNPKTGIPGHLPPGVRSQAQQFHPPPTFPGLMSPTNGPDIQSSRMGRSERRPKSSAPSALPPAAVRTPRFAPLGAHASPMPSILLDPHHQPSSSGFGGRSVRRNSRPRYQGRADIVEDPLEEDESAESKDVYESGGALGESRWETSPTRSGKIAAGQQEEHEAPGGGVLGLLYQFQKTHTTGRPGANVV